MQILTNVTGHEKWLRGVRIDKTDKERKSNCDFFLVFNFFFAADLNVYLENSKQSKQSVRKVTKNVCNLWGYVINIWKLIKAGREPVEKKYEIFLKDHKVDSNKWKNITCS